MKTSDVKNVRRLLLGRLINAVKEVQDYGAVLGVSDVINRRSYDPTRYAMSPAARSELILAELAQLYQDEQELQDAQIPLLAKKYLSEKPGSGRYGSFFAKSGKRGNKRMTDESTDNNPSPTLKIK